MISNEEIEIEREIDFIQNHYKYERAENFVNASTHIKNELEKLNKEKKQKRIIKKSVETN